MKKSVVISPFFAQWHIGHGSYNVSQNHLKRCHLNDHAIKFYPEKTQKLEPICTV